MYVRTAHKGFGVVSDMLEQKALKERGIDKMLSDAMENNKDYEASTPPR